MLCFIPDPGKQYTDQDKHKFQSVSYYRKESFSRFAYPKLIEQIRAENDIVVTAIGD